MSARHARPTRAQARAGRYALQPQAVWECPDRVREPALPYRRGAADRPASRRRLLGAAQQMLAVAAAVAAAGFLGIVSSSDTLAVWSDDAAIDGTSISSGETALVLGGALPAFLNALPGEQQHYAFSITNAGDVDLSVSTRIQTAVDDFDIRALIIGAGFDCEDFDLSGYPALSTTAAGAPALILAGEQLQVCAVVTALPTVEPEDSAEFTLVLEGVQAP